MVLDPSPPPLQRRRTKNGGIACMHASHACGCGCVSKETCEHQKSNEMWIRQKRHTNTVSNETCTRQKRHTKETCKHWKRITNIVSNQTYAYQNTNVFDLYICTNTSLFAYNTIFVCLFWCIYIYMYICIFMYVCMYVYMYVYIYVHVSLYTLSMSLTRAVKYSLAASLMFICYTWKETWKETYLHQKRHAYIKRETQTGCKNIWACEMYDSVQYMSLWNIYCLCSLCM